MFYALAVKYKYVVELDDINLWAGAHAQSNKKNLNASQKHQMKHIQFERRGKSGKKNGTADDEVGWRAWTRGPGINAGRLEEGNRGNKEI